MSTVDYGRFVKTAQRLITRFGADRTMRKMVSTGPSYDPVETFEEKTVNGVITTFNNNEIDGSLILATDKLLIIDNKVSPEGFTSVVDLDGKEYNMQNYVTVKPAETVIVYKVQLRG